MRQTVIARASLLGALFVFSLLSCSPEPGIAPLFRRGLLELGRLEGTKIELREFRGSWSPSKFVEIGSAAMGAEGAIGFASGLIALRFDRKLQFYAPKGSEWEELRSRRFKIPHGCRFILDFEADSLALGFAETMEVYRFTEGPGWQEDEGLLLPLPKGWRALFNLGFSSIGIVVGDRAVAGGGSAGGDGAVLMQRLGQGWEEAPDGSFLLPDGWRSVFGFQANGVGILMDDRVDFLQYLDGGWRSVSEASLEL